MIHLKEFFVKKSLGELVNFFDETKSWDSEVGEITFSDYVQLRKNHVGIISLTENKENLLMWAHYANEHRGIVAGIVHFEDASIFENLFSIASYISSTMNEKWSLFNGIPKPVSYRKGLRYRNDKVDYDYSNITVEGADRILHEIFLQKSDEWIYEQEYRVVLRLEQADRVILPSLQLIGNKNIIKMLENSKFISIDSKGYTTIDLYKIKDEILRLSFAIQLAKLGSNPKVIFFMKLNSSAISSCLLGLNCSLNKDDVLGKHAISTGYFNVWRARKNLGYYSISFDEI